MKITFSRELTLQKAEAYLEIEKKVIRKDIQDYLNGKHFKNPLIESRVKKYLQEIGVFNSASFLTRKGEEIKKTGETYEVEKGKYTIWYIENDFVLGTKILFFSRKDATTNPKKENIAPFSVDFTNEEHLLLPSLDGKTDFSKFKLRKQTFFAKIHSPDKLFFKWVWNGLDSSYYEFQGKLGYNEIKAMNIPCDKNLEYEIQKFKGWNVEQRRLTRNFDEHSEEEKKKGVIASSAGNHAQGVAYGAKESGIKAVIVMPKSTPLIKVESTKQYGSEVILYGDVYDDAYKKAKELGRNDAWIFEMRGTILLDFKRYEEALDSFKKAYDLNDDSWYLYSMGECLRKLGRYQEAIEVLLESRQISIDKNDVVDGEDFELAYCYIGIGDKEKAQKYLDSARDSVTQRGVLNDYMKEKIEEIEKGILSLNQFLN